MWTTNYAKCLIRGHVLSTFNHKGEEYNYCVRCGKISLNQYTKSSHNAESKSNRNHVMTTGMKLMMDISK